MYCAYAAVSLVSSKIWCALSGEKVLQLSPCGEKQSVMVLGVCTLQLRFVDLPGSRLLDTFSTDLGIRRSKGLKNVFG